LPTICPPTTTRHLRHSPRSSTPGRRSPIRSAPRSWPSSRPRGRGVAYERRAEGPPLWRGPGLGRGTGRRGPVKHPRPDDRTWQGLRHSVESVSTMDQVPGSPGARSPANERESHFSEEAFRLDRVDRKSERRLPQIIKPSFDTSLDGAAKVRRAHYDPLLQWPAVLLSECPLRRSHGHEVRASGAG
jgi:hypothetical protein